jgi:hypothetical protein
MQETAGGFDNKGLVVYLKNGQENVAQRSNRVLELFEARALDPWRQRK